MDYQFERLSSIHRQPITDIFNHFVRNTFAAYPGQEVGYEFFESLESISRRYPRLVVRAPSGQVVGFSLLRAFHPAETFRRTAEITYFILPEHTRHGIGTALLNNFVEEAKHLKIESILASMSSLNEQSVAFHLEHGFRECGRFLKAGRKFSRDFDVIWMQKSIQ